MDNIDLTKKFALALNINLEDYKIKILDEFIRNCNIKNNHYSDQFSSIDYQYGAYQKIRTFDDLNRYVNDAIGFKMSPEQILYYSDNCFGTADSKGEED